MRPQSPQLACTKEPRKHRSLRIIIPEPEDLVGDEIIPDSPHLKRPPEIMGALYEDVEKFFGDIFAWYGRLVARCPLPFVIIPLVVCGLLGLGLFELKYEDNLETLYTPIDSDAAKDQVYLLQFFPDYPADDFYPYQPLSHGTYGEVMITTRGGNQNLKHANIDVPYIENVINKHALTEIAMLIGYIKNISIHYCGRKLVYQDICAKRNETCFVSGMDIFENLLWSEEHKCYVLQEHNIWHSFKNESFKQNHLEYTIAHYQMESVNKTKCISGSAFRFRFYLNETKQGYDRTSLEWQKQFLQDMPALGSMTNATSIHFSVAEALDIELSSHVSKDTRFLIVSVITMLLYATLQGGGGNCVSNHVTLAYAGVFAALLSILAAFGFLSVCGLRFVNMSGVMPFLVIGEYVHMMQIYFYTSVNHLVLLVLSYTLIMLIIGIGVDDMFQLMTEWRQTNIRDSIEERMGSTLRGAAVSITITSLTDLLAFCIGATSPFISVKHFCATSGMAIFFCYINQLTFFSGIIVLHARRVQDDRHCITCLKAKSREEMEEEHKSSCAILLCSGHSPQKFGDEGGLCKSLSRVFCSYYPRFILHWLTKCVVILLFGVYMGLSMWGSSMLLTGFKVEDTISSDSNVYKYLQQERNLYPSSGPTVMFVVERPVLYFNGETQKQIEATLSKATGLDYVPDDGLISWLAQYKAFLKETNSTFFMNEEDFIKELQSSFFKIYPQYINDVLMSEDNKTILTSRFYVLCSKLRNSSEEVNLMHEMRQMANDSPIPFTAYSTDFLYYEHYVCILKNTLLAVGVSVIGMLFVALVFIPHPIAVSCVTLSMISVVLGMVGFMTFWGLALSAITTIQIILSVGICVDSTVHISHAFMTATGKNRNERVSVALEKVGIPILNGAMSSLLGIMMLSLGGSYIFTSFFKTMFLVVVLGLLHSLVFLPVMLSFIGPRRTSKPRVFIPVSPSSRSLQDMYRANSVCLPPPIPPPAPIIVSKSLDFDLPPTLKTRSLTDIHQQGLDSSPAVYVREPRRVSFAVGDERKYTIDKSLLETKVDHDCFRHHRLPQTLEEEEEEEDFDKNVIVNNRSVGGRSVGLSGLSDVIEEESDDEAKDIDHPLAENSRLLDNNNLRDSCDIGNTNSVADDVIHYLGLNAKTCDTQL